MADRKEVKLTPITDVPSTALEPLTDEDFGIEFDADTENLPAQRPAWSNDISALKASDMAYPLLRLAHSTTPEVKDKRASEGDWLLTGFPPMQRTVAVPLRFAKRRAFTSDPNRVPKITFCTSVDGVHGNINQSAIASMQVRPTGLCETCPMEKWMPDPTNSSRNIPPRCVLSFCYVCYLPDVGMLAEVDFKKTAMGAAQIINSLWYSRGFGFFAIELASRQEGRNAPSPYYVPTVTVIPNYDTETLEHARQLIEA